MKSKLYLFFITFLIMFLMWCLFNECTMWVLEKLRFIDSDSSYSPVYFLTAFVFSAIAAIWPRYFKRVLLFILVVEFSWLIIFLIQGNEDNVGYIRLLIFNNDFFILVVYLVKVGAFWGGYWSGKLGLSHGLAMLVCEMINLGLSIILTFAIYKLSIWLTDMWIGKEQRRPPSGYLS